jgi:hypothetical protein
MSILSFHLQILKSTKIKRNRKSNRYGKANGIKYRIGMSGKYTEGTSML